MWHESKSNERALTLNSPGLVCAQHDIDHQGELRSALTESLDKPEHAEVVGQVNSVLRPFLFPPPNPEALPYGRDVPTRTNTSEKGCYVTHRL